MQASYCGSLLNNIEQCIITVRKTGWIIKNRSRLRLSNRETEQTVAEKLNKKINNDRRKDERKRRKKRASGFRDTPRTGVVAVNFHPVYDSDPEEVNVSPVGNEEDAEKLKPKEHARWQLDANGKIYGGDKAFFVKVTEVPG